MVYAFPCHRTGADAPLFLHICDEKKLRNEKKETRNKGKKVKKGRKLATNLIFVINIMCYRDYFSFY